MTFSDQPVPQFLLLVFVGVAACGVGAVMLADYRGYLTRYSRSVSKTWWYRRVVIPLATRQRSTDAVEASVRRWTMPVFGGLILIGGLLLMAEFAALVTGHVT